MKGLNNNQPIVCRTRGLLKSGRRACGVPIGEPRGGGARPVPVSGNEKRKPVNGVHLVFHG